MYKNYVFTHYQQKDFVWSLLHSFMTVTVLSKISKPAICLWILCIHFSSLYSNEENLKTLQGLSAQHPGRSGAHFQPCLCLNLGRV